MWSNAITVSSLIVGVLGLTATTTLVATICGIYGIAASASSLLPANQSIQVYSCAGVYSHYTQAAGSSKVYNTTYRYVSYRGYDNLLTDEPFDEPFVMDIDNGKLFSAASEDKTVAILTNDDLHLIDISISYDPACDEVYHWAISDYPVDEFSYSDSFWNSVIAYAENHFEDSDLVLFTTTIYDTSDSSVDASLSSESNLR